MKNFKNFIFPSGESKINKFLLETAFIKVSHFKNTMTNEPTNKIKLKSYILQTPFAFIIPGEPFVKNQ